MVSILTDFKLAGSVSSSTCLCQQWTWSIFNSLLSAHHLIGAYFLTTKSDKYMRLLTRLYGRLVNVLTMNLFQISRLQSTAAKPVASSQPLLLKRLTATDGRFHSSKSHNLSTKYCWLIWQSGFHTLYTLHCMLPTPSMMTSCMVIYVQCTCSVILSCTLWHILKHDNTHMHTYALDLSWLIHHPKWYKYENAPYILFQTTVSMTSIIM